MCKSFFAMRNPSTPSSQSQNLCQLSWFFALLLLSFFFSTSNGSPAQISYKDHCASVVPESKPTVRVRRTGLLYFDLTRSYYWGGDKILGKFKNPSDQFLNDSQTYVSFLTTRNVFETSTSGIYKVEAYLRFRSPGRYSNYSRYGYNYHPRDAYHPESLRFLLNGFWSEHSRKLCMVGAASWQPEESKSLNLEAVFDLNYAKRNSTLFTSLAKGSLRSLSLSTSPSYFETIEIVSFPSLDDYKYTLASKGPAGGCLGGIPSKKPLSLQNICTSASLSWHTFDFELEYAAGCTNTRDCSPFEGDPAYLSLYAFQCSDGEEKLRYMISFQSRRYGLRPGTFDPKRTLVGEGSWDTDRNQLCIVACRILNPFKSLEDAHVGNCSIRLSLRFPVVWTINDTSSIEGLVWTNKTGTDTGYFKNITFSSSNSNDGIRLPGLRYEYTKTEKVKELCPRNEVVKKTGDKYPRGNSYDMRFQMSVKHSKEQISWGNAVPISVGDEIFGENSEIIVDSGYGEEEEESSSYSGHMSVSYKLTFWALNWKNKFLSVNSSSNDGNDMEIIAEGIYDAETGHLCMVGCRELHLQNQSKKFQDCEIFLKFQFPPLNSKVGSSIQGMIQSRREKHDSFYFDLLNISSSSYYGIQAKESMWRMDLEIVLVLISNTLLCIFVASQIFYVKKHPEVLPFISLVMLTVLTLGHMIPLVLNLEALLLNNRNQQKLILGGEGWLEWNELSVRLVNLVVFLLLLCLLQMAWTARMENGDGKHFWGAEKKTVFVTLLLYAVGGLVTLLVEWGKNGIGNAMLSSEYSQQTSTLKYLKSYAGLVLDGFLLPQILLNIFQNSSENALSCLFYIGTTSVRLLPHAYDLYRVNYYMRQDFDGSYIYANPNADFYSIAWDVIIPCGCIVLAVITWLQQRLGGRCILPPKIQELAAYEKVPVVSNE